MPTLRSRIPSRRLATLMVVVLAGLLLAVPNAIAEDDDGLKQRQQKVQKQIKRAADDLHQSSKRVRRLNSRLTRAQSDLASARRKLTRVRGQLRVANVRSVRVGRELQRAEFRLKQVTAELRQARRDVQRQRGAVRKTVTDLATDGDPRVEALTSMLDSGSLEELMINQTAGELVVNTQFASLQDLETAEAAVAKRKKQTTAARNRVAQKKQQAEALLRRTKTLYNRSASAKRAVNGLVTRTAQAKRQAQQARRADRQALKRLERREKKIRRKILAARGGPNFRGTANGYLRVPVDGQISSPYGYRKHPIYGYYGLHDGVDFAADCGSPLYAGSDGKVVSSYFDEVYGFRLYLDIGRVNGDRLTLVYNHMSGPGAGAGKAYARGDVLGKVGTTGWSTGCHLHFTVLRNGDPVDPMIYL